MKTVGVILAIAAAFIGGPALSQQRHIPRDQLEEMFSNIRAQTPWNIKGNMLWGYFFTGPDESELKKVGAALIERGYHFVEVRELESKIPQPAPTWQLHVERIETQTVDTLDARNSELETLASQYGHVVYDGMDVGPAD